MMLRNISIYQNLGKVNILLWNEVLETQNPCLLDIKYKEDKKYNKYKLSVLNSTLEMFFDDYFVRLNNKFSKANLVETQEKIKLTAKVILLEECIKSLLFIRDNAKIIKEPIKKQYEVLDCVKKISSNFVIKRMDGFNENIESINKILVSNRTTLQRNYPEVEKKETTKNYTFEKQLVDVEQCLGRGIDVEKTNVYKWIEYINLAEEISKKRLENHGTSKR
jgi:hypothetical protein